MVRSLRIVSAAIVLGTMALGTTAASAHGFGFHFGGFHGAGIHLGGFRGAGLRFGHFGGWGPGWRVGYRPVYNDGCYIQRWVDVDGFAHARTVCY